MNKDLKLDFNLERVAKMVSICNEIIIEYKINKRMVGLELESVEELIRFKEGKMSCGN